MTSIQQLPLELFRAIINRLSRKDLSTLSRTSKPIRMAVEPILYREITFEWKGNGTKHPPVHLLLRSILNRPALATYVERLDFCGKKPRADWLKRKFIKNHIHAVGMSCSIWESAMESDFTSAEMMLVAALISSLNLSPEDVWFAMLYWGEVDVFVALLLFQTLNLRQLRLDSNFQQDTCFVGFILTEVAAMSQGPRLKALEHIDFSSDIVRDRDIAYQDVDFDQILPLFSIPSIKRVRMALPAKCFIWPSQKVPKSSLTSLILHHTQLPEEMLGQVLLATPSLRSLQYHFWYNIKSGNRLGRAPWEYFDCAKLSQSLACVQRSLEHLVISVHSISVEIRFLPGGFGGIVGRLGTLHGFQKLSRVEIPTIVLLGWTADSPRKLSDVLPPSLRHLCLTDDLHELGEDEWGDEALLPLIQEFLHELSTSDLKGISLLLNHAQVEWCEEARTKLQTMCERAHIQCSIVKNIE